MYQFSFLPYFPKEDIIIEQNRVRIFNFWNYKDTFIKDAALRDRIQRFCELYVYPNLETVRELAIAVIDDNYSFTLLNEQQQKDLQRYARALMFCSLAKNDDRGGSFHSNCTSEQFTLFHQNFTTTEETMRYTVGSYVRVDTVVTLDSTRFIRPEHIPQVLMYRFDDKLFGALANAIDAHKPKDDFLFRALDWVRFAYQNSEGFNYESRPVMLATTFEHLFKLPFSGKTEEFASRLEKLLEPYEETIAGEQVKRPLPMFQKTDAKGGY